MKRKIYKLLSSAKQALFALALIVSGAAYSQASYTLVYTGAAQTLTLPAGNWGFQCWAGNGGDVTAGPGGGGKGGYSSGAFLVVTPGTLFNILVGGKGANASGTGGPAGNGGWNGGGGGGYCGRSGGGGGGATDVRVFGNAAANRIIVAGGGGGAAYYSQMAVGGHGGAQAGLNGDFMSSGNVLTPLGGGAGANGGTPGPGGVGYPNTNGTATGGGGGGNSPGGAGTQGTGGGDGGIGGSTASGATGGSGGGGGGYAGGAGGTQTVNAAVGGGGGSGYIGGVTSATTIMFGQPGYVANPDPNGNGRVIITELCNITLVSTADPICAGTTVTLSTNAVSNYSWSNGGNTQSIVVTPSVTTTYSVTGTSSANCTTMRTITITVSSGLPVLSVTSSTNSLCLGKTVTLTAAGALTYTWTNGVTNGATFSPSVTNTYTVTGANGCGTSTAVTTVSIVPLQVLTSSSPTQICASSPATLMAAAAATTFTWFPIGPQGSVVAVNPSVTTLYTVIASDGTCAGTGTVLLSVVPIPTITAAANATQVCEGYPVNLTASGGLSYTWTPGNLPGSSITVNPMAPTLYSVVGTNSLGCIAGAPLIVITSPSPTITLASSGSVVCAGAQVILTAGGGSTYIWTPGGAITASIAVNPTVSTSYSVTGTGGGNTCTATQSITVNVFVPALTASGTGSVCSGSNATLTASGADSYNWDNGSNGNLIVVTPSATTVYTITGTSTSSNVTCNVVKTLTLTVLAKPLVTATNTQSNICKGESAVLTAGGAASYTWTSSNGGSFPNSTPITVTPTLPVIYTYSVIGTAANGCTNVAFTQVKVGTCPGIVKNAEALQQVSIYPNPSNGEFTIASSVEITLQVVNGLGQTVKTIKLNGANNYKSNITDLAAGVYFVSGQSGGHKINQKIIVNK